jgi:transposase
MTRSGRYPYWFFATRPNFNNMTRLVEDNAPCHTAAQKVDEDERERLHIRTFDFPAHSPDMNKIERCWDYEKAGDPAPSLFYFH